MTFLRIVILLYLFVGACPFSQNRFPLLRDMLNAYDLPAASYPPHRAAMNCFIAGDWGEGMRGVWVGVIIAIASTLAHAEDMAEMISRYRREHGLSTVKTDPQLTAIAERQAKAMAASRIAGVRTGAAAENIAAGQKTWAETFRMWQASPGHNANLLQTQADLVGVAVARNEHTRYKTFWAMVIAEKPPKRADHKVASAGESFERRENLGSSENPISTLKNFVCKYLC